MTGHRRLGIFATAVLGGLLAVGTAVADTGPSAPNPTHTVKVADDTEAWFQVLPVSICSTPIGCPPPLPLPVPGPSSVYPVGALEVGSALGTEISRTYLRPALYSLPAGSVLTAGIATVPINADPKAGTINAGSAKPIACLVTAPVTDGVQGSLEDPPAVDCNVTSKVVVMPKGDAFSIDLAPFITAWRAGKPNDGFALLPQPESVGTPDVWQVAMNGREASGPHVSFQITYSEPTAGEPVTAPTPVTTAPPAVSVPPVVPPGVTTTQPPVPAPVVAAPQPVAEVTRTTGFKYSAVFLVPLAFLFALAFLGRTFTRDATPLNAAGLKRRD